MKTLRVYEIPIFMCVTFIFVFYQIRLSRFLLLVHKEKLMLNNNCYTLLLLFNFSFTVLI